MIQTKRNYKKSKSNLTRKQRGGGQKLNKLSLNKRCKVNKKFSSKTKKGGMPKFFKDPFGIKRRKAAKAEAESEAKAKAAEAKAKAAEVKAKAEAEATAKTLLNQYNAIITKFKTMISDTYSSESFNKSRANNTLEHIYYQWFRVDSYIAREELKNVITTKITNIRNIISNITNITNNNTINILDIDIIVNNIKNALNSVKNQPYRTYEVTKGQYHLDIQDNDSQYIKYYYFHTYTEHDIDLEIQRLIYNAIIDTINEILIEQNVEKIDSLIIDYDNNMYKLNHAEKKYVLYDEQPLKMYKRLYGNNVTTIEHGGQLAATYKPTLIRVDSGVFNTIKFESRKNVEEYFRYVLDDETAKKYKEYKLKNDFSVLNDSTNA